MAITIKNERLRKGELKFVLGCVLVWVIFGVLGVIAFSVGQWSESLPYQNSDWWALVALVCIPGLISIFMYFAMPQQLLRLSGSMIHVVNLRSYGRRFSARWSDVEKCSIRKNYLGILAHGKRIELVKQSFTKEGWELLCEEFETKLTPYFNLNNPTKYDMRLKKQSEWSFWRKVLDKLIVIGVAISLAGPLLFGFALGSYLDWQESIPVGVFMFAGTIPSIIIVIVICSTARRQANDRWHERLI